MLWGKSALTAFCRFGSFVLILLSCTFLGSLLSVAEASPVYLEMTNHNILQGDTLVTYIAPVVAGLSVETSSSTADLDFRMSFFANVGGTSVVQMQPRSEGKYNLTVSFETEKGWNYTVGVFTYEPGFYSEYADALDTESGGFVRFYTRAVEGSSGNSTLILMLDSYSNDPGPASPDLPNGLFTLPESAKMMVFVAVTAVLGYANAFLIADCYFKSQNEVVSRKRWALIALLVAVSLWVIYQVYLSASV